MEITKEEKVKNIISFFMIVLSDQPNIDVAIVLNAIINIHPDYLIEKFERYVLAMRPESDWGIHPSLRRKILNPYCKKYGLPITDIESPREEEDKGTDQIYFSKLTWKCNVCDREREDRYISVKTHDIHPITEPGFGYRNVKYCNDNEKCESHASNPENWTKENWIRKKVEK